MLRIVGGDSKQETYVVTPGGVSITQAFQASPK